MLNGFDTLKEIVIDLSLMLYCKYIAVEIGNLDLSILSVKNSEQQEFPDFIKQFNVYVFLMCITE